MRKPLSARLLAAARRLPQQLTGLPHAGGRIAAVSIGAAAVAVLGAAGLAPAMAATGPSMTVNHNSVNISVVGAANRLRFFWAVNGTATWHPETVAGIGSVQ